MLAAPREPTVKLHICIVFVQFKVKASQEHILTDFNRLCLPARGQKQQMLQRRSNTGRQLHRWQRQERQWQLAEGRQPTVNQASTGSQRLCPFCGPENWSAN